MICEVFRSPTVPNSQLLWDRRLHLRTATARVWAQSHSSKAQSHWPLATPHRFESFLQLRPAPYFAALRAIRFSQGVSVCPLSGVWLVSPVWRRNISLSPVAQNPLSLWLGGRKTRIEQLSTSRVTILVLMVPRPRPNLRFVLPRGSDNHILSSSASERVERWDPKRG
jgi:hypothetical protein